MRETPPRPSPKPHAAPNLQPCPTSLHELNSPRSTQPLQPNTEQLPLQAQQLLRSVVGGAAFGGHEGLLREAFLQDLHNQVRLCVQFPIQLHSRKQARWYLQDESVEAWPPKGCCLFKLVKKTLFICNSAYECLCDLEGWPIKGTRHEMHESAGLDSGTRIVDCVSHESPVLHFRIPCSTATLISLCCLSRAGSQNAM